MACCCRDIADDDARDAALTYPPPRPGPSSLATRSTRSHRQPCGVVATVGNAIELESTLAKLCSS